MSQKHTANDIVINDVAYVVLTIDKYMSVPPNPAPNGFMTCTIDVTYSPGNRVTTGSSNTALFVSSDGTIPPNPVDFYISIANPNNEDYLPVGGFFYHHKKDCAKNNFPPEFVTITKNDVLKFTDYCVDNEKFDFYVLVKFKGQLGIIDPGITNNASELGGSGDRRHRRRRTT